ncbi:hypothetical protein [Endozoicomonas atrinae]|uniref:hypothetical protein n=1 Tax=Endozoicomonas atrinae TaxID=1333660 RepID=UPI00082536A0|nr:hypothetical protein [Endozoicomonas atrinae]
MNSLSALFLNAHVWDGQQFIFMPHFRVHNGIICQSETPQADETTLNLEGGYIIPGITDIHTHADFTASDSRARDYALGQGVTRQVTGLCGFHPVYPKSTSRDDYIRYTGFLGDTAMLSTSWEHFFKTLDHTGPVKKYQLFGINSFLYNYPLNSDDVLEDRINTCIEQYQSYPFQGFSLSLNYHPVKSLPTERLYRFMNSLLTRLPVCCSYHVRDQQDRILESIQEVMSWHEGTAARCHISHLKFGGASHKGRFPERYHTLLQWQKSSAFPLSWDTYPFAFASTTLTSLFPTTDFWQEQSDDDFCQWLVDNPPPRLAETTVVCNREVFNQKTLGTIACELGESLEKALLTICRSLNGGGTYQRAFCEEEDLLWLLEQPETFIASDSFGLGQVHPRCTETFTSVLYQAWHKGELVLCEMVQRLQKGTHTVFPDIPQVALVEGQAAELFFFTPKPGSNNQPAFLVRGTIIGNELYRFD